MGRIVIHLKVFLAAALFGGTAYVVVRLMTFLVRAATG